MAYGIPHGFSSPHQINAGDENDLSDQRLRLITRSDFDGLVCAVLLKHLNLINEVQFVHPKDMQDGLIPVSDRDITTNLPYVPGVRLAFDHHASESQRLQSPQPNHIIDDTAPSAARVVYNHYGGSLHFPKTWTDMMLAVDKADSAQFSLEDILHPTGWILLNFIMDPRTGLGRFRQFQISNYQLMMALIDHCRSRTIDEILMLPDVQERVNLYIEHETLFKAQLQQRSARHGSVVLLDLTDESVIYAGNRFMIYALNPQCTLSIHKLWGLRKETVVFAVGKSIINRQSTPSIGETLLKFGGGGHHNAGTCQVKPEEADHVQAQLLEIFG